MRIRVVAACILGLASVVAVLAGGGKSSGTPVFAQLVKQEAQFLQQALAKGKLIEKNARKVKGSALIIAALAQEAMAKGNKAKELATLRDHALKLIQAVDGKKLADAKALAGKLAGKIEVDPTAKFDPVPLETYLKLEFVMRMFSTMTCRGFCPAISHGERRKRN